MKGTCESMCSPREREERQAQQDISPFEATDATRALRRHSRILDPQRAVKRYRRAADGRAETAADVRSLVWLERTVTHLWQVVRGVLAEASGHEEEKGEGIQVEKNVSCYVELYDFVSDRFMAVRKDMILQGLSGLEARRIYQRIIRFHIFFDYVLTQQVPPTFDQHTGLGSLRSALATLFGFYKEEIIRQTRKENTSIKDTYLTVDEFLAYHILLQAHDVLLFNKGAAADGERVNGWEKVFLQVHRLLGYARRTIASRKEDRGRMDVKICFLLWCGVYCTSFCRACDGGAWKCGARPCFSGFEISCLVTYGLAEGGYAKFGVLLRYIDTTKRECCAIKWTVAKHSSRTFLFEHPLQSKMAEHRSSGNIQFLGVARLQDRAIVASHAYNTIIDLNGVKEVLTSDQLSVRPGVYFSFASGGSAWHLVSDVEGRIFILISERSYPVRAANACLDDLQRSFLIKTGTKSLEVKEKGLDKTCGEMLRKLCEKYDDLLQVDKLAAVMNKVDSVKLVLQENVQVALANCVTLENIESAAEDLQAQAGMFKKNATTLKKQMWWKQLRMKLLVALVIVAILLVIIIPIAVKSKRFHDTHKRNKI
ncbi:vesicle-associated membrane protein 7b [Nannochloropsis oceanica]